ncbi:hypothetical protein QR680_014406 [Steinernema hermaphroditum]|uniref:Uncharacterized protein n=1 Tax=Steinernema hermaphroditum TaxID=289476 RepID=A0AA39IAZ0_9BILA|nr:hypothetical protein QR680_014406 [Steinernema hermaphroditum]
MVCVPCIILPVLTFVYIRFIQPLIYRLMPEQWKIWLDSVLYPTCPLQIPKPAEKKEAAVEKDEVAEEACPCATGDAAKSKDD